MRRALLVSYYFPPRFSVGGKRAYRFARYLPDYGWSTTVLTARAPSRERLDPSFSDADLPHCDVRRDYLSDREVARLPDRALGSDGTIEAPTKPWQTASNRPAWAALRAELRFPAPIGPDALRVGAIAARIDRAAREARAELIFASGSPWETVVAAGIAGQICKLPVVVDLRDPWSFGPLFARRPAWVRAVDRAIERALLRRAAALTVTTELTREAYEKLGAARRVECIRNGYDPAVVPAPRRDPRITLIHFGNCYGQRNLEPFLRALGAVVRRRGLTPATVRLLNLGRVAESDLALARELGIDGHFEHTAVIPYGEGIDTVAGADLALVPGFGDEPWFIPGKLYDYLLAQTPVLAVSTSEEIARILERTRLGWTYAKDDLASFEHRIEQAIDARAQGRALLTPDGAAVAALSARATAGELAQLFERVI